MSSNETTGRTGSGLDLVSCDVSFAVGESAKLTIHDLHPSRAHGAKWRAPEHRSREAQRAACRAAAGRLCRQPLAAASAEPEGPWSPVLGASEPGLGRRGQWGAGERATRFPRQFKITYSDFTP